MGRPFLLTRGPLRLLGKKGQGGMAPRGLNDFKGHWQLERKIADRRGVQSGRMEGQAWFSPCDVGLLYQEKGVLYLETGAELNAERSYLWRNDNDLIAVDFVDGCSFHSFSLDAPKAKHFCAPDHYQVTYCFSSWPCWHAEWEVRGPAKDYTSLSNYKPLS